MSGTTASARRRPSLTAAALATALAALAASACAGPRTPLDVGSKEIPIDLLLGRHVQAAATAPVPPLVIPRSAFEPGGVFSDAPAPGPVEQFPRPIPPLPQDCADADPLAPPRLEARNVVTAPPKAAAYPFRTEGTLSASGGRLSILASTSLVTVGGVKSEQTGWTFDVTMSNAAVPDSTTTYRVVTTGVDTRGPGLPVVVPPRPPEGAPRPSGVGPGLYLAAAEGFHPPFPGVAMARFPLELGDEFDSSATDGPTTYRQHVSVERKSIVFACGTPLDVWMLSISGQTTTTGPGSAPPVVADFSQVVGLGTQYGGLFVLHRTVARSATASKSVNLEAAVEPLEAT